jgi:hypothetical protein
MPGKVNMMEILFIPFLKRPNAAFASPISHGHEFGGASSIPRK